VANWAKDAWNIELSTPRTMMESIRLLRVGAKEIDEHRDGIVIDSAMVVMIDKLGLMNRSEPPQPGSRLFKQQISEFNTAVDSTPAWFWLTSEDNSRRAQLEAGKAFVKAQLKATELGLVMHPISQGLQEYSEMGDIYAAMQENFCTDENQPNQTLQMLARVGYLPAGAEPAKPSPRRGLQAHIVG